MRLQWVVVEAVFGQVDDNPDAWTRGQNAPHRAVRSVCPRPEQPDVDARIGANDLVVAEAVTVRDVGQRVSSYALVTVESVPTTGDPSAGNSYTAAHAAGAASPPDSSAARRNAGQERYVM